MTGEAEGQPEGAAVVAACHSRADSASASLSTRVTITAIWALSARPEPVIAAYAKICRRMGDVGAGQLTKMANQIAIAGVVQGLRHDLGHQGFGVGCLGLAEAGMRPADDLCLAHDVPLAMRSPR